MRSKRTRRGNASLELAIFLPLLALMIMGIFTVASYSISHCRIETETRQSAWKFRNVAWRSSELKKLEVPVTGNDLVITTGSLKTHPAEFIRSEEKRTAYSFLQGIENGKLKNQHLVLGGVWDFREIQFQKKRNHSRLELGRKTEFFTKLPFRRDAFRVLGNP